MYILGIDTSCDDTAIAINKGNRTLVSIVSSQIKQHSDWGGVVPSIAKREHEKLITPVLNEALKKSGISIENIDIISVTVGPGLAISLEIGIRKAKEISLQYNIPIFAANHLEGHIFSVLTKNSEGKPKIAYEYPLIALIVSGGHTELVLVKSVGEYIIIGRTLDDACGEAFDKVGKMMGLGYPAGPLIEILAKNGDKTAYNFPVPMRKKNNQNLNFSYSGLKTSVLQIIQLLQKDNLILSQKQIYDISASFQHSAIEHILDKLEIALSIYPVKNIFVVGGVSANKELRKQLRQKFGKQLTLHYPPKKTLTGDNASMIATSCYYNIKYNKENIKHRIYDDRQNMEKLDRLPNLKLTESKVEVL